jgi:hypothetical protein
MHDPHETLLPAERKACVLACVRACVRAGACSSCAGYWQAVYILLLQGARFVERIEKCTTDHTCRAMEAPGSDDDGCGGMGVSKYHHETALGDRSAWGRVQLGRISSSEDKSLRMNCTVL